MEVLKVLILAAMPISEVRGAIPLALYYGFKPLYAYIIAIIGNLLPIPFLLLFLDKIVDFATRIGLINKFYSWITSRVEKKREIVEKYGYIGLTMFVAIPFPVTGAWTGALLAFLLKLSKFKSFIAIVAGVCIAATLVTLTSLGVLKITYIFR